MVPDPTDVSWLTLFDDRKVIRYLMGNTLTLEGTDGLLNSCVTGAELIDTSVTSAELELWIGIYSQHWPEDWPEAARLGAVHELRRLQAELTEHEAAGRVALLDLIATEIDPTDGLIAYIRSDEVVREVTERLAYQPLDAQRFFLKGLSSIEAEACKCRHVPRHWTEITVAAYHRLGLLAADLQELERRSALAAA